MTDETIGNAEQIENTETPELVQNPEGLLRKNKELLRELAELKRIADKARGYDFEEAERAKESLRKAEEERLTKRGEYDKLMEQKSKAYEERLKAANDKASLIENRLKHEKLANALMEKGVLPDRVNYLVRDLVESVELVTTDRGFELRKVNGIGDADEFNQLVEEVKAKTPFFFAASLASGSGATGSQGNGAVSSKKWGDLTRAEKAQAIRDAGGDLEAAQKKFR